MIQLKIRKLRSYLCYLPGFLYVAFFIGACAKSKTAAPEPVVKPPTPGAEIKPQTDPVVASTIGFFMDGWQPKTFLKPASFTSVEPPATTTVVVNVDRSLVISKVPSTMLGNNANTWMTQMVTEPVLINHLTQNNPVIYVFPGVVSATFFSGMRMPIRLRLLPQINW